MKILHINSYYSGSNFYKNLYDEQIKDKLNIDVYVPVNKGSNCVKSNLGNYTYISKVCSKYDRLIFSVKHRKIYNDITKKYEIKDYDIIHAHSLFSNGYIAFKLKKKFGIPYVVAVRNTDVNIFFKYMIHLRNLGVEILKESEKIIFLSKSYRDIVIDKYIPNRLQKEIRKKTKIIPNGIDKFWLLNKNISKQLMDEKKINLVYAGTIDKNKNISTTLKACDVLIDRGYNIEYTIVGRVVDKGIYKKILSRSYVKYLGEVDKAHLIEVYRKNDIFIMPSKTETFGLVYVEAMSQGLPIVYSKYQGFDKQFDEGTVGYHVECMNVNELSAVIIKIVNEYNDISSRCIQNVYKFSWNNISENYIRIYKNILNLNNAHN